MDKKVLDFIRGLSDKTDTSLFLSGYCYYFAQILLSRFPYGVLMYHHSNHFMVDINGRLYDASGDVTEKYSDNMITTWDDLVDEDQVLVLRLIRDCILI